MATVANTKIVQTEARPYRPEIDSLRAVAVIAVLISHWAPKIMGPVNWGHAGVYMFFVISGFVITRGLLRERNAGQGQINVVAFYTRRALRIWPIYYLSIAFYLLIWPGMSGSEALWHSAFLSNLFFSLNHGDGFPIHFWSLSVEEQFYLVWPFITLLPSRILWKVCCAMIVAAPVSRLFFYGHIHNVEATLYSLTSNVDCLAFGALLALFEQRRQQGLAFPHVVTGCIGAVLTMCVFAGDLTGHWAYGIVLWPTAIGCLTASLIAWMDGSPTAIAIACRPTLQYLGRISYGIYLYHLAVGRYLFDQTVVRNMSPLAFFLIAFAITVAVASASWYLIEKPFVALGRRHRDGSKSPRIAMSMAIACAVLLVPLGMNQLFLRNALPVVSLQTKIVDYGPRIIDLAHLDPAGTPIWMKINGDLPPGTVAVIGGERIPMWKSDDVVAFKLTPDLLLRPSHQTVFLEHRGFVTVARTAQVGLEIGSN
ncbi:acyltransferase [Caballeronia sp. LZ033]|uniref:acyltransferase family protein n=1 Tax=Caballeronia sp. LZ033 TaxID=3038566 RepID=UPI00285BFDF8|nr:acyltransferase [Caballeronia sp. LZ033]MDR5818072.1 acyltransferase [Caballeronia sp. LZ033]